MRISIQCPQCRHRSDASAEFVGRKVRCHACGGTFVLTAPVETAQGAGLQMPPPVPPRRPTSLAPPVVERPIEAEAVSDPIDDLLPDMPRASVARPDPILTNIPAQPRPAPVRPPRNPIQRVRLSRGRWIFLVLAIVMPILKFGLPYILPHLTGASSLLPGEPYALDDDTLRSRVADDVTDASFPERPAFSASGEGIVRGDVKIAVRGRLPGFDGDLQIYEPAGKHAARSLPCVLTTAGGGTLLQGPPRPTAVDESMWAPYVQAGFVVVAFRQDGGIDALKASEAELEKSGTEFFKAQAGLVNARNALLFTLARLEEVDPRRIYVVGHSSAGTMALLWAEHEERIRGCAVYATVVDGGRLYERLLKQANRKISPVLQEMIVRTSPSTHAAKLDCPLFLWQAEGDLVADVADTRRFAEQLAAAGKKVQLVTIPQGDHVQSVYAEGLPAAVQWLQDLDDPQGAATRKQQREKEAAARQVVADRETAKRAADSATFALENECKVWLLPAERLVRELAGVKSADEATRARVKQLADAATLVSIQALKLISQEERLLTAKRPSDPDLVPAATREKMSAINRELISARERLSKLGAKEIDEGDLVALVESCELPAWLLEDRPSTFAEQQAVAPRLMRLDAATFYSTTRRDFLDEAKWADRRGKSQVAAQLRYAALLVADDAAVEKSIRWCPTLRKPVFLLQWAFGAELNGFPGVGPANLRAPNGKSPPRAANNDFWLGHQLKNVSGEIGQWLAEGLQSRVDAGSFGDWGEDAHRSPFGHRGIALLDFAPVDRLVEAARADGADVLMALRLSSSRSAAGALATTMVVELHDVLALSAPDAAAVDSAAGDAAGKLWESKPITSARLQAARRQGKTADADFAAEVLAAIDDQIALVEMPQLTAEGVARRVKAITTLGPARPLEALVELRYLLIKKLITAKESNKVAEAVLGEERAALWVRQLANGRRALAEMLAPKER